MAELGRARPAAVVTATVPSVAGLAAGCTGAAAHRDLRDVAATERRFDLQLPSIAFPAGTGRIAQFLYWVNQARASMTIAAASSRSLTELHAGEQRLKPADMPAEQAVAIVRSQLGLPPPESN